MKVLVTGHLGFIGPVLLKLLRDRGHFTVGLDVGYFSEFHSECEFSSTPDEEFVEDLRTVPAGVLDGVEAVIHLAAISNDPMGQLNPDVTNQINFEAGMRFAQMAKSAGVEKFVFASSCSIYGNAGVSEVALDETATFNPVSAYAWSKVNMESELSKMADQTFSPTFMRNATAYGVSSRTRLDLVVGNLICSGLATGKISVLSDGTPWRPLTHIEDIALAATCAVEAPKEVIHNQAFNIGRNDANYTVSEIASKIQKAIPNCAIEILGEKGGDTRSYRVNFDKALKTLPGFSPSWDLDRGIVQLLDWFTVQDVSINMLKSRQFIRLEQLKHLIEGGLLNSSLEFQNFEQNIPN